VTTTRTAHNPFAQPARTGLVQGWCRFWFSPADPVGLHAVRWLAGLLFLAWLLTFAGHVDAFFALDGWLDRQGMTEVTKLMRDRQMPTPFGWSALYLAAIDWHLGLGYSTQLHVLYWLSVAVIALFTLGVATRLTAPLAWVVVASFASQPLLSYDGDALLLILAFYLMIGYLLYGLEKLDLTGKGMCWTALLLCFVVSTLTALVVLLTFGWTALGMSWTAVLGWVVGAPLAVWVVVVLFTNRLLFGWTTPWLLGRGRVADPATPPSVGANLALRLLQVHLTLVIVTTGLYKLQIGEWWAGWAYWYAFVPPFTTTLEQVRAEASNGALIMGVLSLAAYLTLAWQIGFPFFAWQPRCRWLLLGGAVVGWLGMIFVYALPLFGPAILIGCLAFLTPAEWRRALQWVPGLGRLAGRDLPATRTEETAPDGAIQPSESLAVMGRR
jgi:hypothetical protein